MTSPTIGWIGTINHDVLPKLQAFFFLADGLATAVYVVALVDLVIESVWLALRPPATSCAR